MSVAEFKFKFFIVSTTSYLEKWGYRVVIEFHTSLSVAYKLDLKMKNTQKSVVLGYDVVVSPVYLVAPAMAQNLHHWAAIASLVRSENPPVEDQNHKIL